MGVRVIVISGPIAAGKSTLSRALADRFGCSVLKTRDLIQALAPKANTREELQAAGERLDKRKGGRWVAEALGRLAVQEDGFLVVDSVRTIDQVEEIRAAFGMGVVHVHLTAAETKIRERYARRGDQTSFDKARSNPTEKGVETLARESDICVDTGQCEAGDVLVRVASQLGLYGRSTERLVDVIVGAQYGSEGKGHIASYLAPDYDYLVRVGGPNAGHTVYEEPSHSKFHHLPSGTERASNAQLIIGPGAVLSLEGLLEEIATYDVSVERLCIDGNALIIEEADRSAEKRLTKSIGSTGQGVGAATARKVLRKLAKPPVRRAQDIDALKPYVQPTCGVLENAFAQRQRILLEGTQGTALSLHHGPYPYVTSRDTTASGCLAEAGIPPSRVRRVVMVTRTYPIRVQSPKGGTSGEMKGELDWNTVAERSEIDLEELLENEKTTTTKRQRRVAEFDWELLRRAATLNGPTDIALSFVDYLDKKNRDARRFEQLTEDTLRFIEELERVAAAPVSLIATRFHYRSIIDRRAW